MSNELAHKTAIRRNKMSAPTRYLMNTNHIRPGQYVLDYGCGKGDDVWNLKARGVEAEGYDPYYQPIPPSDGTKYDVVICQYVLNVTENNDEMQSIIDGALGYAKPGGDVFFTVRRDIAKPGLQRAGTWQRDIYLDENQYEIIDATSSYWIYRYVDL